MSKESKINIDPSLFKYDHPLIEQLEKGEITPEKFLQGITPTMPIVSSIDRETGEMNIKVLSEDEVQGKIDGFVKKEVERKQNTGDLTGTLLINNKDIILSIYPELQELYDGITLELSECSSCQKNKVGYPIVEKILKLEKGDRDISSLKNVIPELAYRMLDGENVQITEDDISIPPIFNKEMFPLKSEKPKVEERHIIEFKLPEKNKQKLILRNGQAAGDTLMLTAAVKALMENHGDKFQVAVETSNGELWENNPYIEEFEEDENTRVIHCEYGGKYPASIHKCNTSAYHFIHAFAQDLEKQLGVNIPITEFRGDIHISDQEKGWMSQIEEMGIKEKFWIIINGGKTDFTAKWPNPYHMQKVVDHFKDKITFVQCGAEGGTHRHHKLDGVIDLIGKTDLRQFIRLIYHSVGVICPVTFAMHAAAAIECRHLKSRPCVVIAGGREPNQWEAYPNHQFLHTCGALKGCHDNSTGGCWKSRCQPVGDGDSKDNNLCFHHVKINDELQIPKCIDMIRPETIIRAVEYHYEGGMLEYNK
jgi:ADP-heptose:LPS heptosyltransferase